MKFLFEFWPQLVIITFTILNFLKGFFFAGQEREVIITPVLKINMILKLIFTIIVLHCGNFFNYIGGAQIIFFVLFGFVSIVAFSILFSAENGKSFKSKISSNSISDFGTVLLLYWGGFFDQLIQYLNQ